MQGCDSVESKICTHNAIIHKQLTVVAFRLSMVSLAPLEVWTKTTKLPSTNNLGKNQFKVISNNNNNKRPMHLELNVRGWQIRYRENGVTYIIFLNGIENAWTLAATIRKV